MVKALLPIKVYPRMKDYDKDRLKNHYELSYSNSVAIWNAIDYLGDYLTRKFKLESSDGTPSLQLSFLAPSEIQKEDHGLDYCDHHLVLSMEQYCKNKIKHAVFQMKIITNTTDMLLQVHPIEFDENLTIPEIQIHLKAIRDEKTFKNPMLENEFIKDVVNYLWEMVYENGEITEAYLGMDKQPLDILKLSYKLRVAKYVGVNHGLLPVREEDIPSLFDITTDLYGIYTRSYIDQKICEIQKKEFQKQKKRS